MLLQLPSHPASVPVPETEGELEDGYDDDYDEFDEDTMDVEDIPEDAEFEWCWDEEGRMKIEEVNKTETEDEVDSKQGQPEEVKTGVNLWESEKRLKVKISF